MKLSLAFGLLIGIAGSWSASSLAACPERIREFALLTQLGQPEDSAAQYRQLQQGCGKLLLEMSGLPRLPQAEQHQQLLELGRRLYMTEREGHAKQAGNALASAQMPDIDIEALKGIGPEDAARALGGMALDVAAAALNARQRGQQAQTMQQMADQFRGNEQRWGAAPAVSGSGNGTVPPQPPIALPPNLASQASCNGTLEFLAPLLRPYRTAQLQTTRRELLSQSIPAAITAAKQQGFDKPRAIQAMRQQAAAFDTSAAEAAQTADQTDGRGSVSIPQARADQLPLDFPCDETSIHASSVCTFIISRWTSLAVRAESTLFERCWKE